MALVRSTWAAVGRLRERNQDIMNSRSKAIAGIAAIVLLIPGVSSGVDTVPEQWRNSILWNHVTDGEKIGHFQITPLGSVFVSTDNRVAALDPDKGDLIWERDDIKRCGTNADDGSIRCNFLGTGNTRFSVKEHTNLGLFISGFDRLAVLNLATGTTVFDSVDIPLKKVRAYMHVPELDQFLLSGKTDGERGVIVAGDPDSCINSVRRHEEIGADQTLLIMQSDQIPHKKVMRSIKLFGEQVIPAFE